eukprot:7632620-Pyramimonas_sp.AAC.1
MFLEEEWTQDPGKGYRLTLSPSSSHPEPVSGSTFTPSLPVSGGGAYGPSYREGVKAISILWQFLNWKELIFILRFVHNIVPP